MVFRSFMVLDESFGVAKAVGARLTMKNMKGMKGKFSEIILELKRCGGNQRDSPNQLLTYLKLSGIKQGFLINFNVERFVDGLRSFVL